MTDDINGEGPAYSKRATGTKRMPVEIKDMTFDKVAPAPVSVRV